jgi:7-cyano-7-deazaguanine synthase
VKKAICIISGGMDSSTTAYIAKKDGYDIVALHFSYGQRTQRRELLAFRDICRDLDIKKKYEFNLNFFDEIGASALIDRNINVPITGIVDGEIPTTYVPFRNGIFISIATALAEKEAAEAIYIGVVQEDSSGYPDCRESFIKAIQNSINLGTKSDYIFQIKTPLINLKKEEIVTKAIELGVRLDHTWSCYQNEDEACGECDSCRLRLKGFQLANSIDKIKYMQIYQHNRLNL